MTPRRLAVVNGSMELSFTEIGMVAKRAFLDRDL